MVVALERPVNLVGPLDEGDLVPIVLIGQVAPLVLVLYILEVC